MAAWGYDYLIAGIQRSISEVRRVNFDCKEDKRGRIYLRFFLSLFSQFWLFRRGPSFASDSHFFVTFVKGLAKFCYFRNFSNTLANVLGFFITEFNHRQYLR